MKRNPLPFQTPRIAAAIGTLVMTGHNLEDVVWESVLTEQHLERTGDMRLHQQVFLISQVVRLVEDFGRDIDFAYVLHQAGYAYLLDDLGSETEKSGEHHQMH